MKSTPMQKSLSLPKLPALPLATSVAIFIALVVAAAMAFLFTPRLTEVTNAPSLETTVPKSFGDWQEVPSPFVQVSLTTGLDPNMDQPYDQVSMRTYVNSKGQQVMLALAWGKRQKQEVKIHRPDLCYVAQGYKIASLKTTEFDGIDSVNQKILGKQMVAKSPRGGEAVLYWMRIGGLFSEDAFATRMYIMKEGFSGRIPDGILVRASLRFSTPGQEEQAWPLLDAFLVDLVKSVPPETRALLLGTQGTAPAPNGT